MSTLYDFQDVEPLQVREIQPVHANDRLVGWAGPSNREENVVVSHRRRYEYQGGKQDYFRLGKGYTFDSFALSQMEAVGADRIAVFEVDNDRLLEYDITQFKNADLTSDTVDPLSARSETGAVNNCVPIDEALLTWDIDECRVVNKDGERETGAGQ